MSLFGSMLNAGLDMWNGNTATTNPDGTVTITGLSPELFEEFLRREYNVNLFFQRLTTRTWSRKITFYEFFVPEMIYLINLCGQKRYISSSKVRELMTEFEKNTWWSSTTEEVKSPVDLSVIGSILKPEYEPKPYQKEFVEKVYYQKKTQYRLNGYLLALDVGMGKSYTSILLGAALHKTKHIVIGPLSVCNTVWPTEFAKFYIKPPKIWYPKLGVDKLDATYDVYILNYESIGKLHKDLVKYCPSQDTIVIVDECHNFKDYKSKRTKELVALQQDLKCPDILLMSGTPIKSWGIECVPIFQVLDNFCTEQVLEQLKQLNRFPKIMNELLHNRLGMMMYRKLKSEELELPPLVESELKIKIPNGDQYTLKEVKKVMIAFRDERTRYYQQNYDKYEKDFLDVCQYVEDNCLYTDEEWARYKEYRSLVSMFHKNGYSWELAPLAVKCSNFEKEIILPRIPNEMKKKFRQARAVVKYIELKVMGEVLGQVLGRLRIKMTCEMLTPQIAKVIREAEKKTLIFSSYTDVIKLCADICNSFGFDPVYIDGSNSKRSQEIVGEFKSNPEINPLIASLKVMATGHTLNEANTVIFLNNTFRSVDKTQAMNRCYRIGQDTTVYVYTLILDTGDEPNLSTRMQDILDWSQSQFEAIVGTSGTVIDNPTVADGITAIRKAFNATNLDIADRVEYVSRVISELDLI